jgi:hypothetical protein
MPLLFLQLFFVCALSEEQWLQLGTSSTDYVLSTYTAAPANGTYQRTALNSFFSWDMAVIDSPHRGITRDSVVRVFPVIPPVRFWVRKVPVPFENEDKIKDSVVFLNSSSTFSSDIFYLFRCCQVIIFLFIAFMSFNVQ